MAREEATMAHADNRSTRLVFSPGTTLAGRNGLTRNARRSPAVGHAVMDSGSTVQSGINPASGPKGLTEPIPVITAGFGVTRNRLPARRSRTQPFRILALCCYLQTQPRPTLPAATPGEQLLHAASSRSDFR